MSVDDLVRHSEVEKSSRIRIFKKSLQILVLNREIAFLSLGNVKVSFNNMQERCKSTENVFVSQSILIKLYFLLLFFLQCCERCCGCEPNAKTYSKLRECPVFSIVSVFAIISSLTGLGNMHNPAVKVFMHHACFLCHIYVPFSKFCQ